MQLARLLALGFLLGSASLVEAAPGRTQGPDSVDVSRDSRPPTPHEREFRTRARAFDPGAHRDALVALLASADWMDRNEAFDTLLRALSSSSLQPGDPEFVEFVDQALPRLRDEHPNVRARAFEWLARVAPERVDVESLVLERCEAPLEAERIAVARVLGICRGVPERGALEFLFADPSERVREEALRSALGRGDDSHRELTSYFEARIESGDFDGAEQLLDSLDRSCLGPRVAEHLAQRRPSLREIGHPGALGCVARIQGLLLRHSPTLRDPWATVAEDLVLGLGGGPSRSSALRRAASLGGSPLGLALVELLGPEVQDSNGEDSGAASADAEARIVRGGPRDPHRREHFELCLASVDAEGLEALLAHGDETGSLPFEDGLRTAFWEQIPVSAHFVYVERALFELTHGDADVRHRRAVVAVAIAALDVPDRTLEDRLEAANTLGIALLDGDPGTASLAFRSLAHSELAPQFDTLLLEALETAKRLDPERFRRLLRDLPEQLDAPVCLGGLEAMGEADRGLRTLIAGVLSRSVDGGETPATLGRWLQEEVDRLLGESPEDRRSAIGPCMEMLRARARTGGDELPRIMGEFLDRLGKVGVLEPELLGGGRTDPGKVAASALARHEGGRELRAELLARESLRRRIRIELALGWMEDPHGVDVAPARTYLTGTYDGCDGELRGRILEALAQDPLRSSGDFLLEQVLGANRPGAMRSVALGAFLLRPDPGEVAAGIERCLREAPDVDIFVQAIEGLGRRGLAERTDALDRLWSAVEGDAGAVDPDWLAGLGGWAELSEVYDAREIVLLAWAGGERVVDRAEALFPGPLEWAEADLDRRWKGERVPGLEFRHRAELGLTAGLARENALGGVLASSPGRWLAFDADLLLQMADRAAKSGDQNSRRTLLRGALIALHGETPEGDWRTREVATRLSLMVIAERAEDLDEFARRVATIELDYLVGRVPERLAEEQFGVFDARAGVDPGAWLATVRPLAEAWGHWTREEDAEAHRLMAVALGNIGFSGQAAEVHGKIQDLMRMGIRKPPSPEDR